MSTDTRFVFGPRDRRGFVLGLRIGQVAILAVGGATVLSVVMATQASPVALVAVVVLAFAAGVAAFLPLHGRGIDEWAPAITHFVLSGHRTWRSPQPHQGQRLLVSSRSEVVVTPRQPAFPPILRHCTIQAVAVPRGTLGVVRDRERGTWTAVLQLRGSSYALLDSSEKTRRMAAWGVVQERPRPPRDPDQRPPAGGAQPAGASRRGGPRPPGEAKH